MLLTQIVEHGGDRRSTLQAVRLKNSHEIHTDSHRVRIKDLSISWIDSHRWQQAARLPDERPLLVRRIKELQPEASTRSIAKAVGTSHVTVIHDLRSGNNLPPSQTQDFVEAPSEKSDGKYLPENNDERLRAAAPMPEPALAHAGNPSLLHGETLEKTSQEQRGRPSLSPKRSCRETEIITVCNN